LLVALTANGREPCKAITKALHPAPFMIYRHQQAWRAQGVNLLYQLPDLLR